METMHLANENNIVLRVTLCTTGLGRVWSSLENLYTVRLGSLGLGQ